MVTFIKQHGSEITVVAAITGALCMITVIVLMAIENGIR
jgi:hypothetical protein